MQLPTDFVTVQSLSTFAGMTGAMLTVAAGLYLLGVDEEMQRIWVVMLSLAASLILAVVPGNTDGAIVVVAAFNGALVGVTTIIAFTALRPALEKYRLARIEKKETAKADAITAAVNRAINPQGSDEQPH